MPFYTKKFIDEALRIKSNSNVSEITTSYHASGPDSYYDSWLGLIENNSNAWIMQEGDPQRNAKTKIIISSLLFRDTPPDPVMYSFINQLLTYPSIEVYLWLGKNVRFAESKPISNSAQLWQTRQQLTSMKGEDVKHALSHQGQSFDDIKIIDDAEYTNLISILKISSRTLTLPLSYIDLDKYFENIDVSKLTCVDIYNILSVTQEEIDFVKKLPNIAHIIINIYINSGGCYDAIIGNVTKHKSNYALNIMCDRYKQITIASDPGRREVQHINLMSSPHNILEELTVKYFNLNILDLQACSKLRRLTISESSLKQIDLTCCHSLEELDIQGNSAGNDLELDLRSCHLLKKLIIKNVPIKSIIFDQNATLSYLEIDDYLHSLEITHAPSTEHYVGPAILCMRNNNNNKAIEARKTIYFTNAEGLSEFKVPGSLTTLNIPHELQSFTLDIADAKQLEALCINSGQLELIGEEQLRVLTLKTLKLANLNYQKVSRILNIIKPSLNKLTIQNLDASIIELLSRHTQLHELTVTTITSNIQLSKITNLKSMIVNGRIENPVEIDIMNCVNLTEFEIPNPDNVCILGNFNNVPKTISLNDNNLQPLSSQQIKLSSYNLDCIADLPNAKLLVLSNGSKESLKISNYPLLQVISIAQGRSNIINLSLLPALVEFTITDSDCETIIGDDILYGLKVLEVTNCKKIKNIDLTVMPNLESIIITSCPQLNTLDFSFLKYIKHIYIETMQPAIDLSNNINLESLSVTGNFEIINTEKLPNLKYLDVHCVLQNKILQVKSNYCPKLKDIRIFSHTLDLTIKNSINIKYMHIHHTGLHLRIQGITRLFSLRKFLYEGQLKMQNEVIYNLPANCQYTDASTESRYKHVTNIAKKIRAALKQAPNFNDDVDNVKRFNERSPVSIYQHRDKRIPDNKTGKNLTPFHAQGQFSVTFIDPYEQAEPDNYHIIILDRIISQDNQLKFITDHQFTLPHDFLIEPSTKENKCALFSHQDNNAIIGRLVGDNIDADVFYSLPSKTALGSKKSLLRLMTDHSDDISLYWNEKHKQFYIKAKKPIPHLVFIYEFSRTKIYEQLPRNATIKPCDQPLLSDDIIQFINDAQPMLPQELQFIFHNSLSLTEKIMSLARYFIEFKDVELDEAVEDGTINTLLQIIAENRGVCRHRSSSMLLLAQYLGANLIQIENEQHSFCLAFFTLQDGTELQLLPIHMGGTGTLDSTPINVRDKLLQDAFSEVESAQLNSVMANNVVTPLILTPEVESNNELLSAIIERIYLPLFRELVESRPLSHWSELLQHHPLVPLVKYQKSHQPFVISQQIHQHKKKMGSTGGYLYINKPEDFAFYFDCFQISGGKRLLRDGPLKELINQGGVLVINWDNFTATQMASYKSILDQVATILGAPISKQKVKVIGITRDLQTTCSAFLTRCKLFSLPDTLIVSASTQIPDNNPIEYTINLFNRVQWRESVLGKIIFSGNSLELFQGKLVEAIQAGGNLVIINPPKNNNAFDELINRLKYDDYVLYNGEKLIIPSSFSVTLKHEVNHLPANNINLSESMPDRYKKPIHIGLHNIHQCFEKLAIADKRAKTDTQGLLHKYDDAKHYFYITEIIPRSDWDHLNAYVKQHYRHKTFSFILAPGAAIEGVLTNINQPRKNTLNDPLKVMPLDCNMILSNDPDFTASLLMKTIAQQQTHAVEIIYVSHQTTYGDLVAQLDINPQIETGMVEFVEAEGAFIKALSEGKSIIACGELSYGLCQKLNSFLGAPAYYYKDGKRIEFAPHQKVYSIQPSTVTLTGVYQHQSIQFELEDYKKVIDPVLCPYLDQIIAFNRFAHYLPLGGEGRPLDRNLSFKRIERMIRAIQLRPRHPHNPIKGLYHYDYPRNTQDYAYLNVIAKILFQNETITFATRGDKLNQLKNALSLTTVDTFKLHIWPVLNCFSKDELLTILGHDLSSLVTQGYPAIEKSKLELAWQYFNNVTATLSNAPENNASVIKREQQLSALLQDDSTHIVMLKGAPGVGKTRTARQQLRAMGYEPYEGEADIAAWQSDLNDSVLLLDEANMALPGTWDRLKGSINKHKKIIATCNPESFNRYYHDVFQQYAETIYFKMPTDSYTQLKILVPLLLECLNDEEAVSVSTEMLLAYNLVKKCNPTYFYSTRDLENLCQRFIAIYLQQSTIASDTITKILYAICVSEFSGTIFYPAERDHFNAELCEKFGVSPEPPHSIIHVSDTCLIPNEKSYIIDSIEQCLLIRNKALDAKKLSQDFYYKRGVLIEGDAGLGKSYLIKAVLEKHGFTHHQSSCNNNTNKHYYELSVSKDNAVRDTLITAYLEGSAVILDELNLDEALEELLLKLLSDENVIAENDIYYLPSLPKKDELLNYKNSYICLNGGDVYYINEQGASASLQMSDIAKFQALVNTRTTSTIGLKQALSYNEYKELKSLFVPKPGGVIFGSQNSSSFAGRKSVSSALRNRLQVIYMEEYLQKSLVAIAETACIPEPAAFVGAYLKTCLNESYVANMRTFYHALTLAKERCVVYEKQIREIYKEVGITQLSTKDKETNKNHYSSYPYVWKSKPNIESSAEPEQSESESMSKRGQSLRRLRG
ncbi:MAG: hypothetical protein H0U71_03030 [Gammaproteobacteria bacterium]|nr:hypothetical protein [Gammaproteobacteria bacterium]